MKQGGRTWLFAISHVLAIHIQSPLYLLSLTSKSQATSFSRIPPWWSNAITIMLKGEKEVKHDNEPQYLGWQIETKQACVPLLLQQLIHAVLW